ncbi:MAG: hypothetical protein ACOVLH_03210 [Roseateles sp.]|jgi:hypothetical protein
MMSAAEFALVLAWLLLPPLALAMAVLLWLHRRNAGRPLRRTAAAMAVLVLASAGIALGFVLASPPGIGRWLGVRDTPLMWAPFAFIAAGLALPLALWWASRKSAHAP